MSVRPFLSVGAARLTETFAGSNSRESQILKIKRRHTGCRSGECWSWVSILSPFQLRIGFISVQLMPIFHRASSAATQPDKSEKEIQDEIAALFRQITASVTFLPQLAGDCTFNVLVYADADSEVPVEWGDSDAKEIVNGERVQLRGFSTSNHRVDTLVSYRLAD